MASEFQIYILELHKNLMRNFYASYIIISNDTIFHNFSCKAFAPSGEKWAHKTQKSLFGRQSSISISIMYNITDWTAGMTHFIKDHALKINYIFFVS